MALTSRPLPRTTGRVSAACYRFEADWKAGLTWRIEDEITAADEAVRTRLFRDLTPKCGSSLNSTKLGL